MVMFHFPVKGHRSHLSFLQPKHLQPLLIQDSNGEIILQAGCTLGVVAWHMFPDHKEGSTALYRWYGITTTSIPRIRLESLILGMAKTYLDSLIQISGMVPSRCAAG
jgi:hypothetical protein